MPRCTVCDGPTSTGCIHCGADVCATHQVRAGACAACAQPRPPAAHLAGLAAFVAVAAPLVVAFALAFARVAPGNRYNFKFEGNGWSTVCLAILVALAIAPTVAWRRTSRRVARRLAERARLPVAVVRP